MITLLAIRLVDEALERVRRNHHDAISELQRTKGVQARYVLDVELEDGIATPVFHGLGRPAFATHAPPRGPSATGRIEEIRDGSYDRSKYVVLKATGYGATVTVDLEVKPL